MPYGNRLPAQSSESTFELGNNRYLNTAAPQAQPQDSGAVDNDLADPQDNLADVEGLTDKYYDTWGKLKTYTHDLKKTYGLDVTTPDYTQPGGGLPFKTYQKLQAALMHTANSLGNKMKEQTQMRPYVATGQVTQEGDNYKPSALLPEVGDILKKLDGPFYNDAEAKRAHDRLVLPMLQQLQQRPDAATDPLIQHNIEVLKNAGSTWTVHPSLYRDHSSENEEKAKRKGIAKALPETAVLKKLTADKNGAWEEGTYSSKVDPSTGKTAMFNPQLQGKFFGSYTDENGKTKHRIIEGLYRRPDKTTWLSFAPDESGDAPEHIRVDQMTGDSFTSLIQTDNPTFGKASNMYAAADALDYLDFGKSVDEEKLYGEDHPLVKERQSKLDKVLEGSANAEKIDAEKERIKTKLDDMSGYFGDDTLDVSGHVIHKSGSKFYIGKQKDIKYTQEEIMKIIEDEGYFDKLIGRETTKSLTPEQQARAEALYNKHR